MRSKKISELCSLCLCEVVNQIIINVDFGWFVRFCRKLCRVILFVFLFLKWIWALKWKWYFVKSSLLVASESVIVTIFGANSNENVIKLVPFSFRWDSDFDCIFGDIDETFFQCFSQHDDVIKWEHFPRYWPFVRGIHRSPANSPHIGQWHGALMFSLICVWINSWVNNREACDLRRYRAHNEVTVMLQYIFPIHIDQRKCISVPGGLQENIISFRFR